MTLTPKSSGTYLLGAIYRSRGEARGVLQYGADRLQRAHLSRRSGIAVAQAVVELEAGVEAEVELSLNLRSEDAEVEIEGLFLIPEARAHRAERWMSYLHFMHTHLPYPASPTWVERFAPAPAGEPEIIPETALAQLGRLKLGSNDLRHYLARYDAALAEVDAQIGEIIEHLKALDQLDGTLIVITSDHGEEFLDHGGMNHGRTLYSEMLRVPLIISGSGLKGRQISGPASILDVYPTLAELFGWPSDAPMTGRSLLPAMRGEADLTGPAQVMTHTPIPLGTDQRLDAVIDGGMKLIVMPSNQRFELYDLRVDPQEQNDLAAQKPAEARRLNALLVKIKERRAEIRRKLQLEPSEQAHDAEEISKLRDLGYID